MTYLEKELKKKFEIACKKCGSKNVDIDFYKGFVSSECGDVGSLSVECKDCGNEVGL